MKITASHLYSFHTCPHLVWRDAHDNPSERDPENEFVKLLWERGIQHEKEVMEKFYNVEDVLDLSTFHKNERAQKTTEAMELKAPWIYQGRLEIDNLLGEPDLLKLLDNGEYITVDIKSGMGLEGGNSDEENSGKPKKHYALQLALYTDALRRLNFAKHFKGLIWDNRGNMVEYELDQPQGSRNIQTWWEYYEEILLKTRNLLENKKQTQPALGSNCKLCHWGSSCKKQCESQNALSLIPELGRSKQESMMGIFNTVKELSQITISDYLNEKGKTGIPGIGEKSLEKFSRRAKLITSKQKGPVILKSFAFPDKPIELFFDIEADPTQDIIYLHGIVEQKNGDKNNLIFHDFTADDVTSEAEEKAWQNFWDYIRSLPTDDFIIYYYSPYEKTQYKYLSQKYPNVASSEEVESLFKEKAIDLYSDIIRGKTEWSTYNHSIKTLAQHLGFSWRDKNPSGAASIQWFNEWCKEKDPHKLQRILDYNEDDCLAMIILKDELNKHVS